VNHLEVSMRKPISPAVHSALDYTTAAATALAPRVLDFPPSAARASHAFAGAYTPFAAFTRSPAAVKPAIPLRTHRNADVMLAFVLPALPWLLGFSDHRRARNFFLALTAVTLVVTALTDWDREPAVG
jgi:hypothetical protein